MLHQPPAMGGDQNGPGCPALAILATPALAGVARVAGGLPGGDCGGGGTMVLQPQRTQRLRRPNHRSCVNATRNDPALLGGASFPPAGGVSEEVGKRMIPTAREFLPCGN